MKKLINDPRTVAEEAVAGFAAAHADLVTLSTDPQYVRRAEPTRPGPA